MTQTIDHIRHALSNFGKAELREVAARVGASRDALMDFAESSSLAPPADVIAKLEEWWGIYSLRRALDDPRRKTVCENIAEECGLSNQHYSDFVAGLTDLDAGVRAKLAAAFGNGGRALPPAEVKPVGAGGPPMPAAIRRAVIARSRFAALPIAEQERLLGQARSTAA